MVTTAVELENLNFSYRKRAQLFTDFSVAIPKGQMTALIGPSGCGKSTLLFMIAGFLRPQSGRIMVDGLDILSTTDARLSNFRATHIGFVFQDFVLDPRSSILEAVLEPCIYAHLCERSYITRARSLLEKLGVEAPSEATSMEISGGQAQRVGLARAVLLGPSIILADEPTGNLDRESARVVLDALMELTEHNTTVIIATHDDRVTTRAHNVVRLGCDS